MDLVRKDMEDLVAQKRSDGDNDGEMMIGKRLRKARIDSGISAEKAAEALSVSIDALNAWESGKETPGPDMLSRLCSLYGIDSGVLEKDTDWTAVWGRRYPVLLEYGSKVDTKEYSKALELLISRLEEDYGYSRRDAFLVLKDILYKAWKS